MWPVGAFAHEALHQAVDAGVVPGRVGAPGQQRPADIGGVEGQHVRLAVSPNLLQLAARHHVGHLAAVAADLAGQADQVGDVL